jgi:rRNA small subunit pseudouridine methyltransferase Nep1
MPRAHRGAVSSQAGPGPFHLVLADAALELVPKSLREHPSVLSTAQRTGIPPERTLLDSSFHHRAMRRLPDAERRGRPDIVHVCALLAMGSRLAAAGRLRLWIHTYGGEVISLAPGTRLPRVYDRFKGLMGQLLAEGAVPRDEPLLVVEGIDLAELVASTGARRVVALSSRGAAASWQDLFPHPGQEAVVMIGAYPRGPLREATARVAGEVASVAQQPLEAWTVEAEWLAHLARVLNLP